MSQPGTAREALLVEAIGDFSKLLDRVESLQSALLESSQSLTKAQARLTEQLAAFDAHVVVLTDRAKVQTVKHIVARADEAAARSIDQQTRAMADAARVALGAELGATMQRLQRMLQPLLEQRRTAWQRWLTHAAAAAAGSATTAAAALYLWTR